MSVIQKVNNKKCFFDVLLTVHLSIFILVINQLDAQRLYNTIWPPDDEHMVLETCTGMK